MISLKKLLSIIALSVFVTGCGIIDTEQAGEALALKEQVLRLQIEELDPLMDQLADMQSQIAPLEEEIEDLEDAREHIYDEARDIGDQFEREMGGAYDVLWQGEEEARRDFEDQLEEQYDALEREWDELEKGQQEMFRSLDQSRDDTWDELEDTTQAMWMEFEDGNFLRRKVIEKGDPEIEAQIEALEDRRKLTQADNNALNALQMAIRKQEQELEMQRFDIEDELDPLWERLEEMHNESNQIWEQEQPMDFEHERNLRYESVRDKQQQIEAAWDNEQDQKQIDFQGRNEKRETAQNDHQQILMSINEQRGEAYDQDEQAETGENADADIAGVDQNYNEAKSVYRELLAGTETLINELSAAQSSDGGSVDTSAIVAGLDSSRLDLTTAQEELVGAPQTIPGGEESNPIYAEVAQAKTTAEEALVAANEALVAANALEDSDTKAQTQADAQAAVDSAQTAFDAASSTLDNTPERVSTPDSPNPGYAEIQSRISRYEALVSDYETQLADAQQGGEATVTDPELTAAYAKKAEYEAILTDLDATYETDIAALRAKVDAGSGASVDVGSLEQEFEAQIQRANLELEEKLKVIDADSYGDNTKSDVITTLENESAALEQEARAIEQQQQAWHRAREEQQKVKRAEIRALEEEIDPIQERQKELNRSQRPLRKESMIIENQRMAIQEEQQLVETELQPLWDVREEAQEGLWEEFEITERDLRRAMEMEIDDLRDEVEDAMEDQGRAIEDEMMGRRDDLQERMRGLEDQRDQFDDAFNDEIKQKQRELDDLIEVLREESMQPLEDKSVALDEEIDVRWATLDVLYQEQAVLTDQMKELEVRIRDLDRQAEFGVLNVLTGALENVAELEKSGGVGSFDSFIPGVGGGPGFDNPDGGDGQGFDNPDGGDGQGFDNPDDGDRQGFDIPDVGDLVPSN